MCYALGFASRCAHNGLALDSAMAHRKATLTRFFETAHCASFSSKIGDVFREIGLGLGLPELRCADKLEAHIF